MNQNSVVPPYVFEKVWQEASFVISSDFGIRSETRQTYEYWLHSGAMHMSTDEAAKAALRARIAAIDAFNEVIFKARRFRNAK